MAQDKYKDGAFIFYRMTNECQPMWPRDVAALAKQHGIADKIVPQYAGDHEAAQRAIAAVRSAWRRKGILLPSLSSSKEQILIAIVHETKDVPAEKIDFNQADTFRWSLGVDQGDRILGTHEIAQQADTEYQDLKGKVLKGDWSASIVAYLEQECLVQDVRGNGGLYWCPPQQLASVQKLTDFLEKVGIQVGMLLVEGNEGKNKVIVQSAVQDGLADQIERFKDDVAAFNGAERPETLKARIEAFQALRKRATMYESVLSIATEKIQNAAKELEDQVEGLVTIAEHKSDIAFLKKLADAGDDAIRAALEKNVIQPPAKKPLPDQW